MADGKTHLTIALAADVGFGLLAWQAAINGRQDVASGIIMGATIATIVTPDFDLIGKTVTESLIRRIPIFGFFVQVSWYPYAVLSKHRGLSHSIFGTFMRAGYLLLVIAVWTLILNGILAMAGYSEVAHITAAIIATGIAYPGWSLSLLTVWFIHDMLHLAMDTKTMKRFI